MRTTYLNIHISSSFSFLKDDFTVFYVTVHCKTQTVHGVTGTSEDNIPTYTHISLNYYLLRGDFTVFSLTVSYLTVHCNTQTMRGVTGRSEDNVPI